MDKSIRSFIAIDITPELRKKTSILKKELEIEGIKTIEEDKVHITLKFLGDVKSSMLGEIEKTLRSILFKRFKVKLRGIGVFPNEHYIRVVWIGCEGNELVDLAKKIDKSLGGMLKPEPFSAHLTIARVKRKIDLSEFLNKYKNVDFGEFEVDRFELKMSEIGKKGSGYSTLAVFNALE